MKELYIFDFDGVIFKDPWEIHKDLLEKYKEKFSILSMVILETGYVPEHLYETKLGKEYLKLFSETYFSQRMKQEHIDRLLEIEEIADLVIASYNTRETIEKMLRQSNIQKLFKKVFTRNDFFKKEEIFHLPIIISYEKIYFITDTISDIKEAQTSKRDLKIYAVKSIFHKKAEFLNFISEDEIIHPFFESSNVS